MQSRLCVVPEKCCSVSYRAAQCSAVWCSAVKCGTVQYSSASQYTKVKWSEMQWSEVKWIELSRLHEEMTDWKSENASIKENHCRDDNNRQVIKVPDWSLSQSETLIHLTKHTTPTSISNHARQRHKVRKKTRAPWNDMANYAIGMQNEGRKRWGTASSK